MAFGLLVLQVTIMAVFTNFTWWPFFIIIISLRGDMIKGVVKTKF